MQLYVYRKSAIRENIPRKILYAQEDSRLYYSPAENNIHAYKKFYKKNIKDSIRTQKPTPPNTKYQINLILPK